MAQDFLRVGDPTGVLVQLVRVSVGEYGDDDQKRYNRPQSDQYSSVEYSSHN